MPLTSDLTLAATVAIELSVDAADARLPRLISVASSAIRSYLNRPQLEYSAAYVEKLAGFDRARIVLSLTPVIAVASVIGPSGDTVDPSEYEIDDAEVGFLMRRYSWPFTGTVRGGLLWRDPDAGSERKLYTVTYSGGWVTPYQASLGGPAVTLPFEIEEACIQTACGLYRRGGRDQDIVSESLGDYSATYRALTAADDGGIIPASVLPQLKLYRRFV